MNAHEQDERMRSEQVEGRPIKRPGTSSDVERREELNASFWNVVGTLYRNRRPLIGVPFIMAVLAAVITLFISNYYKASAIVLLPEDGGSSISAALFNNLPAMASGILGGASGNYVRYMGILQSRSVTSAAVDSFDLAKVYNLEDEDHPREAAISVLRKNIEVVLDPEFDYLKISATDNDPSRAADLANFLVRRLNSINTMLASQDAANYRTYIEQRYLQARADMDSLLDSVAQFHREHGVYDLPVQIESFFEQMAVLRSGALAAEIQYESLLAQYGEENMQVRASRHIAESSNRKYLDALEGRERILPVSQSEVPDIGQMYMNLELDRIIHQTIIEVLAPIHEHARLREEQESHAVQVLDRAVPPVEKAGPKRTLIVIAVALSALILMLLYILALSWCRTHYTRIAGHLEHATDPSKTRK